MFSQNFAGLALGAVAILIGAGGIAAALRTRRRRAVNPDAYASAGGIVYTVVQIGCSGLLLLGGVALVILMLISHR